MRSDQLIERLRKVADDLAAMAGDTGGDWPMDDEAKVCAEAADAIEALGADVEAQRRTIELLHARAERAEAALKEAREKALEEAAKIAESAPDLLQNSTFDGVAEAIRSLITPPQTTDTARASDGVTE